MRTGRSFVLAVAALLLVAIFFPVITGARTLFIRDLGSTQIPAGEVFTTLGFSLINPYASFGQSYLLNPNLGVLFPFAKGARAANLQILLGLYATFAGVFLFLHRRTGDVKASALGASFFSLSGYVLSSTSFLNAITVIGCGSMALAMLDALRTGRRGVGWIPAIVFTILMWIGGEPVLAAIFTVAIAALLFTSELSSRRPIAALGAGTLLAAPYWVSVARGAVDSYRLTAGFSAEEAFANSMHPMRILEMAAPKIFGDWDSISANWWGFAFTGNQLPYVACTAIGVPALVLFLLALTRRGKNQKFAILACSTFALSVVGASESLIRLLSVFEPFPIRYPVKLHLATSLFISIAAAMQLAETRSLKSQRSERRLTIAAFVVSSLILLITIVPSAGRAIFEPMLWSPSWKTGAGMLPTFLARASVSAAWVLGSIAAFYFMRRTANPGVERSLAMAVVATVGISLRGLMPTAPISVESSQFLSAAKAMHGRLMERAGKDLDPVRRGLFGSYPDDDIRNFALLQRRQLWALSGSASGVRYAFDRDPDGSYAWRMVRLTRHLDSLSWERRLAWLRQSGVVGVISYQRLPPGQYQPVVAESSIGVPAVLYSVNNSLPETRRVSCAVSARTFEEALPILDAGLDDRSIVLESSDVSCSLVVGSLEIIEDSPEQLQLVTTGSVPGWIFASRSFTSRVGAVVNGVKTPVYPSNAAFLGIPVPIGQSTVTVTF